MRLRIVHITQRFYPAIGGVEKHVYEIVKRLAKRHEVVVYTSDLFTDNPITKLSGDVGCKLNGVEVRRFKAFKLLPRVDASVVMPSMVKCLLKERADIIHAHNYCYFPAYSAALACQVSKVPMILTTHAGTESLLPNLRKLYDCTVGKFVLHSASHIIALTKQDADYFISLDAKPEKLSIIPNGVDEKFLSHIGNGDDFKKKYNIEGDVILFVGRLSRQKGLEYLLKAMPKILKENRDAVLVIVGEDFGIKARLTILATQLKIENHVIFTGSLPNELLLAAYDACEVFVLPSICEPFGIVVLEAMARGKPIVATNLGAARNLIQDGLNGFLVEPKKPDQIAEKVSLLLQDKKMAKNMGAINKSIITKFSWDNIAREIEKIYFKVLQATTLGCS